VQSLQELTKLIRYYILLSTTEAGSGHPTSSLSAVELMTVLFFDGILKYDLDNPENPLNDKIIFSKGHASPLFYALFAAAGKVTEEELKTLRKFGSKLEGHPTLAFPYTLTPTGSLGQGLSVGLGTALNAKYIDKTHYKTYVLLGDSEIAEGSVWEAMQLAHHYKVNNLVGILDVNRLGQSGQTMDGHDVKAIAKRISAFGWNVITIDGHSIPQIQKAFAKAQESQDAPVMIVAKTLKGKGVSLVENKDNWHGKALSREQFEEAVKALGEIKKTIRGKVLKPKVRTLAKVKSKTVPQPQYEKGSNVATRKTYGDALTRILPAYPEAIVLDAETSNSTYSAKARDVDPQRYFEIYIAEQNMVGIAIGLSRVGKIPFVSTFAAFLSRAFDQIRMSQYAEVNIKVIGSHAGVSIGEDGASQMGLEDITMFRTLLNSVVLYPSDAVSSERLIEEAAAHKGLVYIRTTRSETSVIYDNDEQFPIGGSKTLKKSKDDVLTVISAGITLHEALKAYEILKAEGIMIRVIDLYSIKPLDVKTLKKAGKETRALITVEDHYQAGGIGEAVKDAVSEEGIRVYSLAVRKLPQSGKPLELLDYEDISARAIVKKVKELRNSEYENHSVFSG
jgi:transketolase